MLDRLLFGPTAGAPPRTQLFPNFHLTLHICCQKPNRAIIFFSLQIGSSTTACSKSFFSFTVNFHLLNVPLSFRLFLCFWSLTVTFAVFQSQSQSHTQTLLGHLLYFLPYCAYLLLQLTIYIFHLSKSDSFHIKFLSLCSFLCLFMYFFSLHSTSVISLLSFFCVSFCPFLVYCSV